jgi:hypothetical protein
VRELRVHDPATAEQQGLTGKGFLSATGWHEIVWEIRLDHTTGTIGLEYEVDHGA